MLQRRSRRAARTRRRAGATSLPKRWSTRSASSPRAPQDLVALFPNGAPRGAHQHASTSTARTWAACRCTEERPLAAGDARMRKARPLASRWCSRAWASARPCSAPATSSAAASSPRACGAAAPYLVDRLRKGKPIPAIDGGRNLMTPVYARDIAHWVLASFDYAGGRRRGLQRRGRGDGHPARLLRVHREASSVSRRASSPCLRRCSAAISPRRRSSTCIARTAPPRWSRAWGIATSGRCAS